MTPGPQAPLGVPPTTTNQGAQAAVSVIIPCYNAERYIVGTIGSVLAQDWPELEIIVVDDGSSDGSAELVRRSFPTVKLVQQANQGVACARNRGIAEARHPWIAFVDADDWWLPGKLKAQFKALAAAPDVRLCYAAWAVWHSAEPLPDPAYLAELESQAREPDRWRGATGWIYPQLLLDCEVWTSTVLVQRSLLDEIGGFDVNLRIGEDYDLWLRAARVTAILRVDQPLALYRQHMTSITRSAPRTNDRAQVIARALQRWGYSGTDGSAARRRDVARALAKTWQQFGAEHLAVGNRHQARAAAWQALCIDPAHWPALKVLMKSLRP